MKYLTQLKLLKQTEKVWEKSAILAVTKLQARAIIAEKRARTEGGERAEAEGHGGKEGTHTHGAQSAIS